MECIAPGQFDRILEQLHQRVHTCTQLSNGLSYGTRQNRRREKMVNFIFGVAKVENL